MIGASMGGMIAQTLAARRPELVRSLVSIMSTTGKLTSGQPSPRLYPLFLRRPAEGKEAFVARMEKVFTTIGSPGFPRDLEEIRTLARESFERDPDPRGPGRQLAAIIASGDRTQELHRIHAPTLVIHGSADRLVGPSGGRATARAIPGCLADDGQGHGPRPAACDLAAPDRRHRPARPPRRRQRRERPTPTGPPPSVPGL